MTDRNFLTVERRVADSGTGPWRGLLDYGMANGAHRTDIERLGPVHNRYPVASGPVTASGLILTAIGVLALGYEVVLSLTNPASLNPHDAEITTDLGSNQVVNYQPGQFGAGPILTPIGSIALVAGLLVLYFVLRRGPRAYVEPRENGVAWGSVWGSHGRGWDEVRWLELPDTRNIRNHDLAARLGMRYRCRLVFTDRTRLSFSSSTIGYQELAPLIRRHCPKAGPIPPEQRTAYRYRFVWLIGGLFAIAAAIVLFLVVTSGPDDASGSDAEINYASGGILMLLLAGFVGVLTYAQNGRVKRR